MHFDLLVWLVLIGDPLLADDLDKVVSSRVEAGVAKDLDGSQNLFGGGLRFGIHDVVDDVLLGMVSFLFHGVLPLPARGLLLDRTANPCDTLSYS